jgi:hypothetical protein
MPFGWSIVSRVRWVDIEKGVFPKLDDNDE